MEMKFIMSVMESSVSAECGMLVIAHLRISYEAITFTSTVLLFLFFVIYALFMHCASNSD